MKWVIKGIVHQFWIYNIFFVPYRKKHFLWKVHLDKTTLTRNNWEKKGCTKSVRVIYIIYIIVLGRTDFVHPFLSIISSQSGFIEMDLLQKMFLLVGHEKNVIYSKLVNNPFKWYCLWIELTSRLDSHTVWLLSTSKTVY